MEKLRNDGKGKYFMQGKEVVPVLVYGPVLWRYDCSAGIYRVYAKFETDKGFKEVNWQFRVV